MKLVHGKIDFLVLPINLDSEEYHIIHDGTRISRFPNYKKFDIPKEYVRKCEILGKFSELEDSDIFKLVVKSEFSNQCCNYFKSIDSINCFDGSDAKYSLQSLLFINDLSLKKWIEFQPTCSNPCNVGFYGISELENSCGCYNTYLETISKMSDDFLIILIK